MPFMIGMGCPEELLFPLPLSLHSDYGLSGKRRVLYFGVQVGIDFGAHHLCKEESH